MTSVELLPKVTRRKNRPNREELFFSTRSARLGVIDSSVNILLAKLNIAGLPINSHCSLPA